MAKANPIPSKTILRQILSRCNGDPRTPGTLNLIAQADNAGYFEGRAIELIQEAKLAFNEQGPDLPARLSAYQQKMQMAMIVMAFAIHKRSQ